MIRTIVASGVALMLSAASGNASLLFYGTDSVAVAPTGTISSGATGTGGGLCTLGVGACLSHSSAGALSSGQIMVGSVTGLGNYTVQFIINGVSAFGSVWDIINTTNNLDTSVGLTNIVGLNTNGSANFTVALSGNGQFTFDIVDLLEQYAIGATDTLPGFLNGDGVLDPANGGILNSSDLSSLFTLTTVVSPVPEPASLGLLISALGALVTVRRRHRASR
jgi:hypothetical protein